MKISKGTAVKPANVATRQPETVDRKMVPVERTDFAPTEAQVRALAYEIYRARCDRGADGDELADWISAERELGSGSTGSAEAIASVAHAETNDAALARDRHAEPES